MKTKLLLIATFLFVGFGLQASTFKTDNSSKNYYNNDYGDSFTFVERDVTFAIFQNGEFDFYINQRNQRDGLDVNYQGNGVNISFNSGYDYGPYVQYDDYGAIIQIEDIPIYYDYYGRVSRIGNTRISYDSGRLVRVGGLHVYYNRQGYYSHYSGYINNYNRGYVFHPYHNYFVAPLFDFRIVSYNPYRNHYYPTRYTYYSDHSKNKYYDKNYKRNGHDTRRVAAKSVPNRYEDQRNDRSENMDRRNTNDRTSQGNRNNSSVNNTDRRTNTVNRPTSNERTSQAGNNAERRTNTVNRPTSNERTSQAGNNTERRTNTVNRPTSNERTSQAGNNTERRTSTVNRPSQNERSANTGRMAENRAPERTAQKTERVQQNNKSGNDQRGQATSRESNGNSGKNEKSRRN
ncbi:MAG: hypothetical protein GZ086_01665 [Gelidibacter sp.]|nr:hypothetical protein [Gelidibacter sp.]